MKLVKNAIKSKLTYNGQEIAFDEEGLSSFTYDFSRNVAIFYVDNSSSSHIDNWENKFLVLGKGPTDSITGSTGSTEKELVFTFLVKQIQNFVKVY